MDAIFLSMQRPLSVGILGPGRSRNGLGPYLARDCERHGLTVRAVAGRDRDRTMAVAAQLGRNFGHAIAVCDDLDSLLGSGIDALVIASPMATHRAALEQALAARVPVFCEKPLVAPDEETAGLALLDGFAKAGLLLVEHCQWPFVLPAFDALWPGVRSAAPQRIAMGLSPAETGAAMLLDSLSHVLSLVQAVVGESVPLGLVDGALSVPLGAATEHTVLRAHLQRMGGALAVELHLTHCPRQPRPAWLSIDGHRIDRQIGAGYAISFAAGDRCVAAADPTPLCVGAFAALLRSGDRAAREAQLAAVRTRLVLFHAITARVLA